MATCLNDGKIPTYMEKWLKELKEKLKAQYGNLPDDEDNEVLDEEGDGADILITDMPQGEGSDDEEHESSDSEDGQPPAKRLRMRMSRKSADAHIAEVGKELSLDLGIGKALRSASQLSRSSCASSFDFDGATSG